MIIHWQFIKFLNIKRYLEVVGLGLNRLFYIILMIHFKVLWIGFVRYLRVRGNAYIIIRVFTLHQ